MRSPIDPALSECKFGQHLAEGGAIWPAIVTRRKDRAKALNASYVADLNQITQIVEEVLGGDFLQVGCKLAQDAAVVYFAQAISLPSNFRSLWPRLRA